MVLKVEEALYYGSDAIFARLLMSAHRYVQQSSLGFLDHKPRDDTSCVRRRPSKHRRQMKAELDASWERLTLDDFFLQRDGLAEGL